MRTPKFTAKVVKDSPLRTIARFFGIVAEWYKPKGCLTIHFYFLLNTLVVKIYV